MSFLEGGREARRREGNGRGRETSGKEGTYGCS